MRKYSPIVLFTYNRLYHLKKTLSSLMMNPESIYSDLFIFSDFPMSNKEESNVRSVRNFLKEIKGFNSVNIVEREFNFGLAKSIVDGVTEVFQHVNSVIVLEDDLVPSPYFLHYMNEALRFYKNADAVGSIHAYSYPCSSPLPDTFFLRGADCWGWGTWKNSWNLFEENGQILLDKILKSELSYQFDLDGTYPFTQMLRNQISGRNNSWAIRWHASMFLANKLCLYPGKSLVKNIGFDGSGTHCMQTDKFDSTESDTPITIKKIKLIESSIARNCFKEYFKDLN